MAHCFRNELLFCLLSLNYILLSSCTWGWVAVQIDQVLAKRPDSGVTIWNVSLMEFP